MAMDLFKGEGKHPWFPRLKSSNHEISKQIRAFCNKTYSENADYLDKNFIEAFQNNTPARFSELFFLQAFKEVGWTLIDQVTGFDFAFERSDHQGRLLVEVTTPESAPTLSLETIPEINGARSYSISNDDVDLALTRLTGAVLHKARLIDQRIADKGTHDNDYKLVAISGLPLNQESTCSIYANGLPPDYAAGFLPIGSLVVDLAIPTIGRDPVRTLGWRQDYNPTIKKSDTVEFNRDSFLTGEYPNIDAIVYSPVGLSRLDSLSVQITTLHNPTSSWVRERPLIGFEADYFSEIKDEGFILKRVQHPDYLILNPDYEEKPKLL
jgi:hypothetical protein